jgi:hypothetical protein
MIKTKLEESQIKELYEDYKNLLTEREDDEKLNELNIDMFKDFIVKLRIQYIEECEKQCFYDYVRDSLHHIACYE